MLDAKYRIMNKNDLKYFLECDRVSLGKTHKKPRLMRDYVWRFQILLRKTEYWSNQKGIISKLIYSFYLYRYMNKCRKHCLEIPINCIREGLRINHLQNIIINDHSVIGRNLTITAGVVIGQAKGKFPVVGDNVIFMINSMILGCKACDNIALGAGSMLLKDANEEFSVYAGSPAKVISKNYPIDNIERLKGIDTPN
ncbi:TPA: hypothetical protein ODN87_002813 [Escherichia coli]|uniref:hypothetical protein n=1 Tax=Escherichia coli TaxID=562 RepID=UPI00050B3BE2|nr:hypothetical protein [Escherichia coli]EFA3631786.1 hypothetical protein [Escherichia coli]EFC2193593.1 hypothetical protein [Escherichia coli]EFH5585823.1 hypothetical protein [Escherichia coli]EJG7278351.1 hypothetical protein [Escherichia coli]EJT9119907.1 hypothetical protein [Escherichia coli]